MDTTPFTQLFKTTARHPDNKALLDTMGMFFTTRVMVKPKRRDGIQADAAFNADWVMLGEKGMSAVRVAQRERDVPQ